MDPLLIAIAFVFGFGARRVGLPPLVGYLLAGFVLHAIGVEAGGFVDQVADVGVLLLLFSIGLKLQLRTLARPVIWAGASPQRGGCGLRPPRPGGHRAGLWRRTAALRPADPASMLETAHVSREIVKAWSEDGLWGDAGE